MSLPTSPRLTPPEYILKMFIMKQSTGASVPTSKYDELVKMYEDKVEEHNQKVYGSQYPDSGFDLLREVEKSQNRS